MDHAMLPRLYTWMAWVSGLYQLISPAAAKGSNSGPWSEKTNYNPQASYVMLIILTMAAEWGGVKFSTTDRGTMIVGQFIVSGSYANLGIPYLPITTCDHQFAYLLPPSASAFGTKIGI